MNLNEWASVIGIVFGLISLYSVWQAVVNARDESIKRRIQDQQAFAELQRLIELHRSTSQERYNTAMTTFESKYTHLNGNLKQSSLALVEELREFKRSLDELKHQFEIMRVSCSKGKCDG